MCQPSIITIVTGIEIYNDVFDAAVQIQEECVINLRYYNMALLGRQCEQNTFNVFFPCIHVLNDSQ